MAPHFHVLAVAESTGGHGDRLDFEPDEFGLRRGGATEQLDEQRSALDLAVGRGTDSPITTGQIGGGPWIISKHSANTAAATDFVQWSTTVYNPDPTTKDARPGLPGYGPLQTSWLAGLAKNPYFAADPTPALKAAAGLIWQGWQLVTYPDQPVWTNTVVTGLVAGKSLSSLLPAFGKALGQAAKAAGYTVATS